MTDESYPPGDEAPDTPEQMPADEHDTAKILEGAGDFTSGEGLVALAGIIIVAVWLVFGILTTEYFVYHVLLLLGIVAAVAPRLGQAGIEKRGRGEAHVRVAKTKDAPGRAERALEALLATVLLEAVARVDPFLVRDSAREQHDFAVLVLSKVAREARARRETRIDAELVVALERIQQHHERRTLALELHG